MALNRITSLITIDLRKAHHFKRFEMLNTISLLTHWSYVFLALTHWYIPCLINSCHCNRRRCGGFYRDWLGGNKISCRPVHTELDYRHTLSISQSIPSCRFTFIITWTDLTEWHILFNSITGCQKIHRRSIALNITSVVDTSLLEYLYIYEQSKTYSAYLCFMMLP